MGNGPISADELVKRLRELEAEEVSDRGAYVREGGKFLPEPNEIELLFRNTADRIAADQREKERLRDQLARMDDRRAVAERRIAELERSRDEFKSQLGAEREHSKHLDGLVNDARAGREKAERRIAEQEISTIGLMHDFEQMRQRAEKAERELRDATSNGFGDLT